jgi:hypothetical protein
MSKLIRLFLFAAVLFVCVACSPVWVNEQLQQTSFNEISGHQSIGQTFVSRYNGLTSIQVYLKPTSIAPTAGSLIIRLTASPSSTKIISENHYPISQFTQAKFYPLSFPPINNSSGHTYYIEFSIDNDSSVEIATAQYSAYLDGALYVNGSPGDEQISFRLGYSPLEVIVGIFKDAVIWMCIFLVAVYLFFLPGFALLSCFIPKDKTLHWSLVLSLSLPIGIAVYPIAVLWTWFFGISGGIYYGLILPPIAIIYLFLIRKKWFNRNSFHLPSMQSIAFALVLTLIILTRFWAIRGLAAPMWGDSVQHVTMTQLFLDYRGLFNSWLPYAPYDSLTVQYNFSLLSALLAWILHISASNATLFMGQMINTIAVLALYPLAVRLSEGNRLTGVLAIAIAGILSPMPAYYVNWGRYAQLTGQAILPAALWLTWETFEICFSGLKPKIIRPESIKSFTIFKEISKAYIPALRTVLLPALVLAGMTLSYYRMPYFYASFFPALFVIQLLQKYSPKKKFLISSLLLFTIVVLSIPLILPWMKNIQGGVLATALEQGTSKNANWKEIMQNYRDWLQIQNYLPASALIWVFIALCISVWKKLPHPLLVFGWIFVLFSLPASVLLKIPGINFINSFSILIALYIPVSLLLSWLGGWLLKDIPINWLRIAVSFILSAAFFFALKARTIANPISYALITKPDLTAMQWIKQNTPEEANFLIEGFRIYNGTSIVGSDAGWWIPVLTRRQTNIPPQYALLNEKPITPDQNQMFINLIAKLESHPLNSSEAKAILCDYSITHIYIGQRRGSVGDGARALFQPLDLIAAPWFHQVYHQDGVYIFRFKRQLCP